MTDSFLASPGVWLGAAAGNVVAADSIVPSDLVGREQGSGRQVRAQVDEPELRAELTDAVQGLAQTGIIDTTLPEAVCKVSLHPENLLPLGLGFLEHLGVQALDRRVLVRLEQKLARLGRIQDVARPRIPVHLGGQRQRHALSADEAFDLLGQEARGCGARMRSVW